jgi:predicted hydrocarbon binding protein
MTSTLPFLGSRTVAMPAEFFGALRGPSGDEASSVAALRDAGYAAGSALCDRFAEWLSARGDVTPELLSDDRFGAALAGFLAESGWGAVTVHALSDAVLAIDTQEWAEADEHAHAGVPSCHVGTGLLAGLLGRVAEAPLSVLEVECRSAGQSRCRFLVGSVDVMQYVFEAIERGVSYRTAAASAATG